MMVLGMRLKGQAGCRIRRRAAGTAGTADGQLMEQPSPSPHHLRIQTQSNTNTQKAASEFTHLSHLSPPSALGIHLALALAHVVQALGPFCVGCMATIFLCDIGGWEDGNKDLSGYWLEHDKCLDV
jgi:hypothetical protein